ncbi:phage tail terminator protein [Pseudomonas aeruginosa]|uniref:phage tail terminator protein n=1 Tax=Pseudomonas aeruginosa TaxID=287 RepID=UPI003D34668F
MLDQVRGAMVGWVPSLPLARGTQFVTGKVLDSDDTTLLWGEIYSTQHAIGRDP